MTGSCTERSDADLVCAAREGDAQALDTLVERHMGVIHLIAYSALKNREAAEDLAQEVLLRALLALDRLEQPGRFSAWITQITRNLAVDWLRKRQVRSRLTPMVPLEDIASEVPDSQTRGVREAMSTQEEQMAAREALWCLPPEERELVLLHVIEGLGQREIAQRLGVHQTTVSRQLGRALKTLRGTVEETLRESAPTMRVSRSAKASATALLLTALVLPPAAKASLATAAGLAMETQAALAACDLGFLFKLKAALAAGGKAMATGKGIIATLGVAAVITGTAYLNSGAQIQPTVNPTQQTIPAQTGPPMVGQVEGTVRRVASDLRSLATAVESYYVDWNSYPPWTQGRDPSSIAYGNTLLANMPTFRNQGGLSPVGSVPIGVTTPIAYITHHPSDPFNSGGAINTYSYYTDGRGWIMVSPGPDGDFDIDPVRDYVAPPISNHDPTPLARRSYDPTNGTVSDGDIWRAQDLLPALMLVREAPDPSPYPHPQPTPAQTTFPTINQQIIDTYQRVRADMRSMATAIEAYRVDCNAYPAWTLGNDETSIPYGNSLLANMPTFVRYSPAPPKGPYAMSLTTPIAYVTHYLPDPFNAGGAVNTFSYYANGNRWIMVSPGPDGDFDIDPIRDYASGRQNPASLFSLTYDPTNGIRSSGDIWRSNDYVPR